MERCILQLVSTGQIQVDGITYEFRGGHWGLFVSGPFGTGFSAWINRQCLLSSALTFGRPVGGLTPEVDPEWLRKHFTLLKAVHQDADMARWTRDLLTLLRISPHLESTRLVPGLAEMIQMCAKAAALVEGRPYVTPHDYRNSIRDALRHHLQAKPGSPHSEMQILDSAMSQITFPN